MIVVKGVHGRSTVLNDRRTVRFFPYTVWKKLVGLFPQAICHRRKSRVEQDGGINDEWSNDCLQCQRDKDERVDFVEKLRSWGQRVVSEAYLVSTSDSTSMRPLLGHLLRRQTCILPSLESHQNKSSKFYIV